MNNKMKTNDKIVTDINDAKFAGFLYDDNSILATILFKEEPDNVEKTLIMRSVIAHMVDNDIEQVFNGLNDICKDDKNFYFATHDINIPEIREMTETLMFDEGTKKYNT